MPDTDDDCPRGGPHDVEETVYRHLITGEETGRSRACRKCGGAL